MQIRHIYPSAAMPPTSNLIQPGWVLGSYGLYWRDTITTAASFALTPRNVRTEQNSDPGGYSVYIHSEAAGSDLLIENVVCDPHQRGFFFRNINRVTLRHTNYNGFDYSAERSFGASAASWPPGKN